MIAVDFASRIRDYASRYAGRTACTFLADGESATDQRTYSELHASAVSVAAHLNSAEETGRGIILAFGPGLRFIDAFIGCLVGGLLPIPVHLPIGSERRRRLQAIFKASGATTIVCEAAQRDRVRECLSHQQGDQHFRLLCIEDLLTPRAPLERRQGSPEQPAFVQFSSGATGNPKGASISHRNLVSNLLAIHARSGDVANPRFVSWLPHQHDMGLIGGILYPLYYGGSTTLMPPEAFLRRPSRWWQAMSRVQATVTAAPDFAYRLAATAVPDKPLDLRCVAAAFCGSELVHADTLTEFARAFADFGLAREAVRPCYGLAEATLLVSSRGPTEIASWLQLDRGALEGEGEVRPVRDGYPSRRVISCGRAAEETQLQIVDPSTLSPLPPGRVGEIWVTGRGVAGSYLGDRAATEVTFGAFAAGGRLGPFLRTGDLGFVLKGELYPIGRLKDVVIVRGVKHSAEDLERTAQSSHVALAPNHTAIFSADDDRSVVVVAGVRSDSIAGLSNEQVVKGIREELARVHQIRVEDVVICRTSEILRTSSGKIRRAAMREAVQRGTLRALHRSSLARAPTPLGDVAPADPPSRRDEDGSVRAYLTELLETRFGIEASDSDRHLPLLALGLDSLRAVQLSQCVRETFHVAISIEALFGGASLHSLAALILSSERVLPPESVAVSPSHQAFQPFPLTDMQEAYVVGRSATPGAPSLYGYWEFRSQALDLERLQRAWNEVIRRHPMLRAVLLENGAQRVLEDVPEYHIPCVDLSEKTTAECSARLSSDREVYSHLVADLTAWPSFHLVVYRLPSEFVLSVGLDGVFLDYRSILIVLSELAESYDGRPHPHPIPQLGFRDYVMARAASRDAAEPRAALSYWQAKFPTLPSGPSLKQVMSAEERRARRFERREFELSAREWNLISKRAIERGLTPASTLLAAYAAVIGNWSDDERFVVNVPLFNRDSTIEGLDRVVGHFSTFTLVPVCTPSTSFLQLARDVQGALAAGIEHSAAGGVRVMRAFFRSAGRVIPDFAPIVFTYAPTNPDGLASRIDGACERAFGRQSYSITQTPGVWIDCQVHPVDDRLRINWDSLIDFFAPLMVDFMFDAFRALVGWLAAAGTRWEESIPDLLPVTQRETRRTANDTSRFRNFGDLLHDEALGRIRDSPESIAVIDPTRQLTYRELGIAATTLAGRLLTAGEGPAAVLLAPGWRQPVAVLACSMAGRPYVPLDVSLPAARLATIISLMSTNTVISDQPELDARLEASTLRILEIPPSFVDEYGEHELPTVLGSDLAYVIFTSGTTGTPKGVMIEHLSAVNTVKDVNARFAVHEDDRILALSSLGFDLSVYDIFGALSAGGAVVYPESHQARNPDHWVELMREHHVTIINAVPALIDMLCDRLEASGDKLPTGLRLVLASGDRIPPSLPHRLWALYPGLQVISLGGATEASIWSVIHEIPRDTPHDAPIPYGMPLADQTLHILKASGSDAPDHVTGELHIGGLGVARGYWEEEEKTAARFKELDRRRGRVYATGDLARYREDGVVEILGRKDDQVKINGNRIELGEIESCLSEMDSIAEVAVVPAGAASRASYLAAFLRMAAGERTNTLPELLSADRPEVARVNDDFKAYALAHIRERLPPYMIPARWFTIDRMPLSRNGKLDRGSLTRLAECYLEESEPSNRPLSNTEALVLQAVTEVLDITGIDPDHDLLALGASSMDLVHLQGQLLKAGLDIASIDLFTHNSVRKIAFAIDTHSRV